MHLELGKAKELEIPRQRSQKENDRTRTVMVDVRGCSGQEVAGHMGIILMSGVLQRTLSIKKAIEIGNPCRN